VTSNLVGLPAASIPAGFVSDLPVGMQLIGNYLSEAKLLNVAHQFQLETDFHQQRPGDSI
jgi:aspartyl-tRNA(Asn)/glutamyl-tRNA(Gln) amidotransferase subunit A